MLFKIECRDCDATYVEQIGCLLKTRVKEYKNDIKKTSCETVITQHRLEHRMNLNWEKVKILDRGRQLRRRLISEMNCIFDAVSLQSNGLNLQSYSELPFLCEHFREIQTMTLCTHLKVCFYYSATCMFCIFPRVCFVYFHECGA